MLLNKLDTPNQSGSYVGAVLEKLNCKYRNLMKIRHCFSFSFEICVSDAHGKNISPPKIQKGKILTGEVMLSACMVGKKVRPIYVRPKKQINTKVHTPSHSCNT